MQGMSQRPARCPSRAVRDALSGTAALTLRLLAHYGRMEELSLSGRLLAATPQLGDPNFRRAVVLIVEDDKEEGTLGVVLNRPTEVPLDQVLEPWTALATGPQVVFRGGPISPNSALALALAHGSEEPVGWRSLDGTPMMSQDRPRRSGRAARAAGRRHHLDAGLRRVCGVGRWPAPRRDRRGRLVRAARRSSGRIRRRARRLWRTVLRRQGGDLALVATFPDDPAWN